MNPACGASRRFLSRLLCDGKGVSSIEFAILAPAVLVMLLISIELALDMMVDASVQLAAQSASRIGLLVQDPSSGPRQQVAETEIRSMLSMWTNMGATVTISEVDYKTYANVNTANSTASLGGYGDIVSYNVAVTMPKEGWTDVLPNLGIVKPVFQRTYLVQNEQ